MLEKLEEIFQRFKDVELLLSDPDVISDMKKFNLLNKEYGDLKDIVEVYQTYKKLLTDLDGAKEMLKTETDPEMKDMAKMEIDELGTQQLDIEGQIKILLIPKDPADDKNAIFEIRSGTGGDEASLFAGELYRLYQRYCQGKNLKTDLIEAQEGTAGGYSRISFTVEGPGAYGILKFESGVHRVQRVPETESQGRVHTSAASVAVLPEADEVDVKIDTKDIKRDTFRASGAGGQHVNKTESAIRLTHLPTGIIAECQDGRSQHKNYEKALSVLRSRIYEAEYSKIQAEIAAHRRSLVSTGDRSAKVRTYNFPQGRMTDHRINLTKYNLGDIMNGDIQDIIDELQIAENLEKMKAGGLN
jgi:peptide chain release factor 1